MLSLPCWRKSRKPGRPHATLIIRCGVAPRRRFTSSIRTSAPKVAANATFAFTAIATKTDSKVTQTGGACGYGAFKTSAFYIFNLPQHTAPSELSGATLANWRSFVSYLQAHEQGHRDMWRQCFAAYDSQALRLTASTCEDLDRRREKLFTSIKRKCIAKDEEYDFAFRKDVRNEPFVKEALQGN